MPNVEWAVPHRLVTPLGELDFNTVGGGLGTVYPTYLWQIQPGGYKIVPSMRVTQDNITQQDGSVLHPRYKSGLVATMNVQYWTTPGGALPDFKPACGADLRLMHEYLGLLLNSIRSYEGGLQRLYWTPTGYGDERFLDELELLAWPDPTIVEDLTTQVEFAVESPFSYAIDKTQILTSIGGTSTLTNLGNSASYPVMKINGAASLVTITNTTTGFEIVYDDSLPGAIAIPGGSYGEVDTFRGTIFLNGSSTDLIAGINPTLSDFFPLAPGPNVITVTGATVDVLWNHAWV